MPSSSLQPTLQFIRTFAILAIIVNASVIWEVTAKGNHGLYEEGAFIESLTATAFLCGAVFLFATSFFRQNLLRFLTLSFATVNATAFLREVDVADYNVPSPLRELASNNLKDTILTVVFLGLLLFALKNYRHRVMEALQRLRNPAGLSFLLGGLIFLVSCIAEKLDNQFSEELLEANASLAFLCGSLLFGLTTSNSSEASDA